MFSLEDIYNRLNAGTPGALRTGEFTNPLTGPIATRHTLNDVMSKAPASDNANGAVAAQVLVGKTYWSLVGSAWGTGVGTMPNNGGVTITPGTVSQTIVLGFHDGTGTVGGDANLVPANIKSGSSIFGVTGTAPVSSGNATAANVLFGQTFSNSTAAGVTGTMPNNGAATITPGTTAQAIAAGYHNGSGTVSGDANLVTGNIKAGTTIFGVAGKTSVVDTAAGTAGAGDIRTSKVAFVNGTQLNGTGLIASGNATANDVSIGKTFSNATTVGVTGTRPPAPVARSGQTATYAAGDDGAIKKGQSTNPRFTDNGNGTVTDNLTGLIWLKNANAFSTQLWAQALTVCNTLASGSAGLTDGSTAGQWRLPNLKELQSLIDFSNVSPALPTGHPFTGIQLNYYWSSTTFAGFTTNGWVMGLTYGDIYNDPKDSSDHYVWPVRGGQ